MSDETSTDLREAVRSLYAEAARAVLEPRPGVTAQGVESSALGSCCGSSAADSCCGTGSAALDSADCFGGQLYAEGETDGLPEEAVLASLGCGNPLAVADLHPGERVLDLGSGGGIDVLLSARRVGPSGFAYGVDMTDDMLTLARQNAVKAGAENVEFLKGEIEAVPLPDAAVDVVISNCVINLSTDKPGVLAEMFRVLVPGGRIGITDVVGSGISAQRLSPGDPGLELLENAAATAAGLFVIILMFGPVSGGHFNPVVSFADAFFGGLSWRDAAAYLPVQVAGCVGGAVLANLMFALPAVSVSAKDRASAAHFLSEIIATLGLIVVIFALARSGRARATPAAVGAYIGAAYFFTSSTSFANPAITIGRMFSNTFAGIAPASAPGFIAAQLLGGALAVVVIRALYPAITPAQAADVLVPHPPSRTSRDEGPGAGLPSRERPLS